MDLFDSGRGLKVWSATPYLISLGSGFITLIPLTEGECVLNIYLKYLNIKGNKSCFICLCKEHENILLCHMYVVLYFSLMATLLL